MAIEDFLGSFLSSFTQVAGLKQRQAQKNKIAKLQGKLLEEQLKAAEDRRGALEELAERTGPEQFIAPTGETRGGEGALDVLAEVGMATRLGIDPLEAAQLRQSNQLQQALFGRLFPQTEEAQPAPVVGGQPSLAMQPGLPESPQGMFGGGLTPSQITFGPGGISFQAARERTPSVISTLRLAGIDPRSERGQELVTKHIAGQDISTDIARLEALQLQLETQQKLLDVQKRRRELATQEKEERIELDALKSDVRGQIRNAREMAEILRDLEGTFAGTGFGSELRTQGLSAVALLGQSAGLDVAKQKELVNKAERFKQLARRFGVEQFVEFSKELGRVSDVKFQALIENDVSPFKNVGANRLALADRLETTLEVAARNNIEIPNREGVASLIQALRGGGQEAPAQTIPTAATRRFNPETGRLEEIQ